MLTLAVFIPVSGWVADRLGARRVFASAIGLFTFARFCAAMSQWSLAIHGGEVLQGMGGAMMVPVGRLGGVEDHREERSHALDRLHYMAGARRAGNWPAGRRVHYDVFILALDFLFECGRSESLESFSQCCGSPMRRHDGPVRLAGLCAAGTSCTSFMYSLELMGQQTCDGLSRGCFSDTVLVPAR